MIDWDSSEKPKTRREIVQEELERATFKKNLALDGRYAYAYGSLLVEASHRIVELENELRWQRGRKGS